MVLSAIAIDYKLMAVLELSSDKKRMYKLNICTEQTTPLLLAEKSDYTLTASKLTQALLGLLFGFPFPSQLFS